MIRLLKGHELIPGKMYVVWGKSNFNAFPAYRQKPKLHSHNMSEMTILHPLEPFVFIERTLSDFRWDDNDAIYDYKVLTGEGIVGWLSLHDDDLHSLGIMFREYDPKDFEVKL